MEALQAALFDIRLTQSWTPNVCGIEWTYVNVPGICDQRVNENTRHVLLISGKKKQKKNQKNELFTDKKFSHGICCGILAVILDHVVKVFVKRRGLFH